MAKRFLTLVKEAIADKENEIWINWIANKPTLNSIDKAKALLAEAGYTPDYENSPQQTFYLVHPVKEEVVETPREVIKPEIIDGMKIYPNTYGKMLIPTAGGSVTVCNFGMELSSCNPHGLGGGWRYKSLEHAFEMIDAIRWLTDNEKVIIKAEIEVVYPENVKKADRVVTSYKFRWSEFNEKYVETAHNVSGYQVDNGQFYSEDCVEGRIEYLRKYSGLPVEFTKKA